VFERIPRVAITAAVAAGLMTISLTTVAGASQAATGTPGWRVAAPKAFIDSPAFTSVTEVPPATVTAIPRQAPFLLHWNGTRWSKVTVPYSAQFAPSNWTIAQDGHGGVWLSVQGSGAMPPGAADFDAVILKYGA